MKRVPANLAAAAITWALYGPRARTVAGLGASYPSTGISAVRVLSAEAIVPARLETLRPCAANRHVVGPRYRTVRRNSAATQPQQPGCG
jgi:hypothetical protein